MFPACWVWNKCPHQVFGQGLIQKEVTSVRRGQPGTGQGELGNASLSFGQAQLPLPASSQDRPLTPSSPPLYQGTGEMHGFGSRAQKASSPQPGPWPRPSDPRSPALTSCSPSPLGNQASGGWEWGGSRERQSCWPLPCPPQLPSGISVPSPGRLSHPGVHL